MILMANKKQMPFDGFITISFVLIHILNYPLVIERKIFMFIYEKQLFW